jgi:cysteine desulfurase family protein
MYYFDQAATSLRKPQAVADAVYQAISSETMGNPSRGGHAVSLQASRTIYETRETIRELLHAWDYHVVLTKNATEALNIAIKGMLQKGDHVIATVMAHNATLRPLYELEDQGVELDFVACESDSGQLLYSQFEALLRKETKVVVVTHASNVTGNVTNLKWLSEFCQKHQLKLIVDGASTVGIIDVQLTDLAVDVFCFTGHKSLYGPQGTGGMCIKKALDIQPIITGGSGVGTFFKINPVGLPESLEVGTLNVHGFAGLDASVRYILAHGVPYFFTKVQTLTRYFYEHVKMLKGVQIYGDPNGFNTGIVALNIGDFDSTEISLHLEDQYGILTRPGAHCAPLMHRHFKTEAQGIVRFSFSAFNTMDEVIYAVNAIEQLVGEMMKS